MRVNCGMLYPFSVSDTELLFHILLFAVAIITPVILYSSYRKFSGEFRTAMGFLTLAFVFSALRWIGGSLARLHLPMTDLLWFNFAWLTVGILAAVFALYTANLLFDLSRKCVIHVHPKSHVHGRSHRNK